MRKPNPKQIILYIITAFLVLWLAFSFIEVNAKNTTENPVYSDYNAFIILLEILKN